ncbi:MAG TPA: class I SAM-dependent methyltransferase [Polyangiales bacterium]|nr:class I SAM-dependent methyltransferase [Polyangiales bacterium]
MQIGMAFDDRSRALVALGHALRRCGYAFVTVTPRTHRRVLERAARRGELEARSLRDVFGWSMPFAPALLPPELLDCLRRADAVEPAGDLLRSRVRVSTLGEAMFVHSAFPTADENAVFFGPDTYRFCALLQRVAASASRIVDIGCGTGAGGIVSARGGYERLVLSDVNPYALQLTRVNAALAGIQAEVVQSDLLQGVSGKFDLIVANPPYMHDPAARTYRHGGGDYGEALSVRIVREALPRLARGGTLVVYTGSAIVNGTDTFERSVQPALAAVVGDCVTTYSELDPDVFGEELDEPAYARVDRIAAVALTVRVSAK